MSLVSSVPALYEKYLTNANPPIDEWTLTVAMAEDTGPGGGLEQMEEHYKTFIVSLTITVFVFCSLKPNLDGARLCADRRCWPQLDSSSHRMVGDRSEGGRTFPPSSVMDVSINVGLV